MQALVVLLHLPGHNRRPRYRYRSSRCLKKLTCSACDLTDECISRSLILDLLRVGTAAMYEWLNAMITPCSPSLCSRSSSDVHCGAQVGP
jgi:hypothetical protein